MGYLTVPERKDRWIPGDGVCEYKKGDYGCQDTVESLVRYVTRTRKDERWGADMLARGWCGIYCHSMEDAIQQLLIMQQDSGIATGTKGEMYHEVYYLTDGEISMLGGDRDRIGGLLMHYAYVYCFGKGFPVVYALHWEAGKGFHIHFAVSGIGGAHGYRRWHASLRSVRYRNKIFDGIIYDYRPIAEGKEPAIQCLY